MMWPMWPMRSAVAVLVTILVSAMGGIDASEPDRVTLGKSFVLRVGESVQIGTEELRIGFEDVAADSRCPKGERCIWEGDATVRVWLQRESQAKEMCELHTSTKDDGPAGALSYEVRLRRLDPHPISGRTIAKEDYRATLEVTRGSSAAPDR
jgi:hypothetical protein